MKRTQTSIISSKKQSNEKPLNTFECKFQARSVNESFARVAVSAFVSQLNPSVADISDLKLAVSEAVTNSIVHAYRDMDKSQCFIMLSGKYFADGLVVITIRDNGCGIEDVKKAVEPLYTTASEDERSGMGFTVMSSFTDKMRVSSTVGKGTTVTLEKKVNT